MESQEAKKPVRINRLPKDSRSATIRKTLKEGWSKSEVAELIGCKLVDVCNVVNRDRQRKQRIKELKAAGTYKSPASRPKQKPKKPKEEYYIQPQSIDDQAIAKHMGALGAGLSNHVSPHQNCFMGIDLAKKPLTYEQFGTIPEPEGNGRTYLAYGKPKKTLWRRFVDFICGE